MNNNNEIIKVYLNLITGLKNKLAQLTTGYKLLFFIDKAITYYQQR